MAPSAESHLLAPPFGLSPGNDARLLGFLKDEDWASAMTVLRDELGAERKNGKLLVLLAHCRFRDAQETMSDHRLAACQEALGLLDQAGDAGFPYDALMPFREQVETTLAEETAHELEVLAKLPAPGQPLQSVDVETLEEAGYLLWEREPLRAAELFHEAAERVKAKSGLRGFHLELQSGRCLAHGGAFERAKPVLELALSISLETEGLSTLRASLESAAAALLEHASGDEFRAVWALAAERGRALGFEFPAVWPNQEALLTRCLAVGERALARQVARTIEDGRPVLSRALEARLRSVRAEA
ncbi:MAG: hypothetical protein K1X89_31425 [Myxococcaceae bacterium]|nr:hypothetical protein [Myxococcaceae bacterium]